MSLASWLQLSPGSLPFYFGVVPCVSVQSRDFYTPAVYGVKGVFKKSRVDSRDFLHVLEKSNVLLLSYKGAQFDRVG